MRAGRCGISGRSLQGTPCSKVIHCRIIDGVGTVAEKKRKA
jgi:hypothetical protein